MMDREDGLPRKLRHAEKRKAFGRKMASVFVARKDQSANDLKARNAYRAACGLPLIEPGND